MANTQMTLQKTFGGLRSGRSAALARLSPFAEAWIWEESPTATSDRWD